MISPAVLGNGVTLLASLVEIVTTCSFVAVALGLLATFRFSRTKCPCQFKRPAVTILKPLCGDEPGLHAALASICVQDYPLIQIIFGVRDQNDRALSTVSNIQAQFPHLDIETIVDPTTTGINPKISNLLNMMPSAKHDILLFSDSDLHVAPDYVAKVVDALFQPGTGLVTTVCTGLQTSPGFVARLGAANITYSFLPSVLASRALGRADCLGTTMALHRDTLAKAGGLAALVRHVGDDNILGRRVRWLGLHVALAATVPATAVPETSLRALWQHELRWARTIRALEPFLFATSVLQYPLFWATIGVMFDKLSTLSVALFLTAWAVRGLAALCTARALRLAEPSPFWFLPLRDIMTACIVAASYLGARVVWRGHVMWTAGHEANFVPAPKANTDSIPLRN